MWIFTDEGFFEITRSYKDRLQVRSNSLPLIERLYTLTKEVIRNWSSDISVLDRDEKKFSARDYAIEKVVQHLVYKIHYVDLVQSVIPEEKEFCKRIFEEIERSRFLVDQLKDMVSIDPESRYKAQYLEE